MTRALLIAVLFLQDPTKVEEKEKSPPIRPVRGDLRIWRAGTKKIEAVKTETLPAKEDRFGTLKGEYALFSTEGGTLISIKGVEVGKEKGLTLERSGKKLLLKLHEGKVVLETFETAMIVETPFGRVEGTQAYFLVEVTEKATRVVAIDGKLTFTNSLGTVTLEPEHETVAAKDKKPSDAKPVDVTRETAEFTAEEAPLNLIKNPGLEEGLERWGAAPHNGVNLHHLDDKVRHSGKRCVRFDVKHSFVKVDGKLLAISFLQDVPLQMGRRYMLRAYLKIENRGTGIVKPYLTVTNGEKKVDARPDCEKAWRMHRHFFTATHPYQAVYITLELPDAKYECSLWADDFYLGEITSTP